MRCEPVLLMLVVEPRGMTIAVEVSDALLVQLNVFEIVSVFAVSIAPVSVRLPAVAFASRWTVVPPLIVTLSYVCGTAPPDHVDGVYQLPDVTLETLVGDATVKFVTLVPVPFALVTATAPLPVACAEIVVSFTTTKVASLTPPNVTAVAPVKLLPVIVTAVPTGPDAAVKLVISGAVEKVKPGDWIVTPPGFVSSMSAAPAMCAGVVTLSVVVVRAVIVAEVVSKRTLLTLSRFVPLITADVPPAIEPVDGVIDVKPGADGAVEPLPNVPA